MRRQGYEKRVGIFVVISLITAGVTAFLIGGQRAVFESKTEYYAFFRDAGGMRPGSPVRVAGVTVGSVTDVEFTPDGRIKISFAIAKSNQHLIRGIPGRTPTPEEEGPQPSRVTIGSKGMLGDKMIDVSSGARSLPEWPPSQALPTIADQDLIQRATQTMSEVEGTARNIRHATDQLLADDEFTTDIRTITHNFAQISHDVAQGNGTVARLLHDEEMANQFEQSLAHFRIASQELVQLSRSLRQIADEVRYGDGSAHQLIYGSQGIETAEQIGQLSEELTIALQTIREGDGTAHELIYGNAGAELLENMTTASADIAEIIDQVRQGRGTIGGLLIDPSIYEDVKRLVGDLQRNDILRALVRYSIRRDDAETPTNVAPDSNRSSTPTESTTP